MTSNTTLLLKKNSNYIRKLDTEIFLVSVFKGEYMLLRKEIILNN